MVGRLAHRCTHDRGVDRDDPLEVALVIRLLIVIVYAKGGCQ